jgi:hypothetical protein
LGIVLKECITEGLALLDLGMGIILIRKEILFFRFLLNNTALSNLVVMYLVTEVKRLVLVEIGGIVSGLLPRP